MGCRDNCKDGKCNPLQSLHDVLGKTLVISEIIRDKWGRRLCEHNKVLSRCKDCGGSQICQHGKQKNYCIECGGSSMCKHGKRKNLCKECGGSILCQHAKSKYTCKDCKGVSVCSHGRQKNTCKDCGGTLICEHKKIKYSCKECGGVSICEHDRIKSKCIECEGGSICEHRREKSQCKECGGSQICQHNRRKNVCKECEGASICNHNKIKYECKDCNGSRFCKHGLYKRLCKECDGSALCKTTLCETRSSIKYKGYCYHCFINIFPDNSIVRNHKTKERVIADYIREQFPEYTIILDKCIENGCSLRRPDIFIDFGGFVLVIEIDENQHETYDCSCENKRLMELFRDAGNRPMVMIRFNPDDYNDHKNKKITSCWGYTKDKGLCIIKKTKQKEWQHRLDILSKHIRYFCENRIDKEIHVENIFYDGWSL